ncbi:diguanylate cyclase [Dyella sp. KULCS107]|uniref:diguanylate cyclase n=1 Tax=Dyella sp. KULCS107 TaxID=3422216 RepID=UPI003D6E23B2
MSSNCSRGRTVGQTTFFADRAAIQAGLQQLDLALRRHHQWYDAIIRTLVCRLPYDSDDVAADAHRRCRFGSWYYHDAPDVLRRHPGFAAIEQEHQRMHRLASTLLGSLDTAQPVAAVDFDAFARALESLRLQIFTLRGDMENALYSLDELTGAGNRLGMLGVLREQQSLVDRAVQSCCVAMMDIDHFKRVNDTWGHLVGDRVLAAAAQYLIVNLRPYDKLFRYGGEEFLLCLPDTDLTTGHALVERLREGLAAQKIPVDGHAPIGVTMSFGVARLEPAHAVEQAIAHADEAMYEAKRMGRNCTRVWADGSPAL